LVDEGGFAVVDVGDDGDVADAWGARKPSAIMAVAEKAKRLKAQGRDIISFSIGVPNFLPGEHVYAAAREALTTTPASTAATAARTRCWTPSWPTSKRNGLDGYERKQPVHRRRRQAHALQRDVRAAVGRRRPSFPAPYWTSYIDIARHRRRQGQLLPCPAPTRTTS
jgi:aspartate aminotransferase